MAHKAFDCFGGMTYVVMVAERALVGADALFERSGSVVRGCHCLLVRGVHPFAGARFTP